MKNVLYFTLMSVISTSFASPLPVNIGGFEESNISKDAAIRLAQDQISSQGRIGTNSIQLSVMDIFDKQTQFKNCSRCGDFVIVVEGINYKFLTNLMIRNGIVIGPIQTR